MDEQPEMGVALARRGTIAILTIENVARRNAFSGPVRNDIDRHIDQLAGNESCRAIVITGAGGTFCAGGDVKEMKTKGGEGFMWRRLERQKTSSPIMRKLIEGPKPVVTAVEGAAFGLGLGLAVAADYTVAATNSRFAAAQIRRGLCPDALMYYSMTARCGPGRAREILLSGREFDAFAAEQYGIVHELAKPGQALAAAIRAARQFAATPPVIAALTRAAMTHSYHTLDAALRAEQDYQPVIDVQD